MFGLALLGLTAARIMARLGVASPTAFLIGAFVVAHAELLLVALGLSLFRGFTPAPLLGTLGGLCLLTVLLTRGLRSGIDWRGGTPRWQIASLQPDHCRCQMCPYTLKSATCWCSPTLMV